MFEVQLDRIYGLPKSELDQTINAMVGFATKQKGDLVILKGDQIELWFDNDNPVDPREYQHLTFEVIVRWIGKTKNDKDMYLGGIKKYYPTEG